MNPTVAGISAVVIILLGVGAYLYLTHEEPLTLSFNVSVEQKSVSPGQSANTRFIVTTNRKAPVDLNYTLISRQGRVVVNDKQSFLAEGTTERQAQIHIPIGSPTGPYWLRARAQSGQVFTIALASIAIVQPSAKPKPIPSKNITNTTNETKTPPKPPVELTQATEPNATTQTPTMPTTPPHPSSSISPGPAPLSPDEIIQNAKTQAATDLTGAADSCGSLTSQDRDSCYSETALAAKSGSGAAQAGSICQKIIDLPARDACLANLALAGDFTVCSMITNTDIKDSCNALSGK